MQPITFFTADFRNDRVHFAGKSYPTGRFTMFLLKEGFVKDAVARVCVFHADGDKVLDFLRAGYLDKNDLLAAGNEINEILKVLPHISPFRMLDIESERARVTELFTVETAQAIQQFFLQHAELTLDNPAELYIRHSYGLKGDPAKLPGRELLDDVKSTLYFYSTLGNGFMKAFDGLHRFMRRLDEVERFDESHLFALAQQVFPKAEFDVRTEYVPYQAKPGGKTVVARRLYFNSYYSFFLTDLYEGLRCGHYPRRCPVCGRYFLMQNARRQIYCNGMAPMSKTGGKKLSCRQWALRKGSGLAKEKAPVDPVKIIYRNRCSAIRLYKKRGKFSEKFAEAAKRAAREHLTDAIRDPEYAATNYITDMQQENLVEEVKAKVKEKIL